MCRGRLRVYARRHGHLAGCLCGVTRLQSWGVGVSTGRPSGDEDDGQRDRRAEQDHQHGQDHGDQPAPAKAPAETRSREEYADDVRSAGWGDQPAGRDRDGHDGGGRAVGGGHGRGNGDAPEGADRAHGPGGAGSENGHRSEHERPQETRDPGDAGGGREPAEPRSRGAVRTMPMRPAPMGSPYRPAVTESRRVTWMTAGWSSPPADPPAVARRSLATGKPTPMTRAPRPVARDLTAGTRWTTRPLRPSTRPHGPARRIGRQPSRLAATSTATRCAKAVSTVASTPGQRTLTRRKPPACNARTWPRRILWPGRLGRTMSRLAIVQMTRPAASTRPQDSSHPRTITSRTPSGHPNPAARKQPRRNTSRVKAQRNTVAKVSGPRTGPGTSR